MYQSSTGATSCSWCGTGQYSIGYGCALCPPGQYWTLWATLSGAVNDGGTYTISCPAGTVIQYIYSASYGCGTYSNYIQGYVSNYCGNAQTCSLVVGTTTFGISDPCTGTTKTLSITAMCGTGSYSCNNCAGGTYQPSSGATTCLSCSTPGTYSPTGASSCLQCPPGQFQSAPSSSGCNSCNSGQYQANNGATACVNCAIGQYQSSGGSSGCILCAAGQYQTVAGSSTCSSCANGYSSHPGSTYCYYVTPAPSSNPSTKPSFTPTQLPTSSPTSPTVVPTVKPTGQPTNPTSKPSTRSPAIKPSFTPTFGPSSPTHRPTHPTNAPTVIPTTHKPTLAPSKKPSKLPSSIPTSPSSLPTFNPTTKKEFLASFVSVQPIVGANQSSLSRPATQEAFVVSMQTVFHSASSPPVIVSNLQVVQTSPGTYGYVYNTTYVVPNGGQSSMIGTYNVLSSTISTASSSNVVALTLAQTCTSSCGLPTSLISDGVSISSPSLVQSPETNTPTISPSPNPTAFPSVTPSLFPSTTFPSSPSLNPSYRPTSPSVPPSKKPSLNPSFKPSRKPSSSPSIRSLSPTIQGQCFCNVKTCITMRNVTQCGPGPSSQVYH